MRRFGWLMLVWASSFGLMSVSAVPSEDSAAFDDTSLEFFEKEVRPILVARCFECHAGGDRAPKGGLRLDSRDAVLKGGDTGPAASLKDPASSLFLSAINYGDIYQMPPKSKLSSHELAVLTKWVLAGLPWPKDSSAAVGTVKPFDLAARAAEHWCWRPVQDVAVPAVKQTDWPVSTIDRFILAKLESRGLKAALPADRRILLRRTYFDLIGLPPTPDEVEQFVHDQDPQAFEKAVDRLLDSVHFGERWARHWMDLTRYAETRGHEFEPIIPNAWQYRDYVIRAFNTDVPYDRFLTEHIAGDLMEPRWRTSPAASPPNAVPINESILGTAFWFLGEEVHSPVDVRKDETDRIDNRLDVMSKTFLGLTIACARCHDHKFDAISQRDYYALAGFAISGSYRQIRVDTFEQDDRIARELERLRSQARHQVASALKRAFEPIMDKLDRYWLIARRILDDDTSNSELLATGQALPERTRQRIEDLARDNSLDPKILRSWCVELTRAKSDKQHPLHELFLDVPVKTTGETTDQPDVLTSGIVVNFGEIDTHLPIQNGVSFALSPTVPGRLVIDGTPEAPRLGVTTIGAWERDLFWKNIQLAPGTETDHGTFGAWQSHGRMVRSPEFTLTAKNLWYLVRGSVRAYASVNSHLMIAGPLHGALLREFKQADAEWHWVSHGLEQYRDHRLHVEFSPADDSPCAIAMIWQGDGEPQIAKPNWNWIDRDIPDSAATAERAAAYGKRFLDAASLLEEANVENPIGRSAPTGQVSSTDNQFSPSGSASATFVESRRNRAKLANWIVANRHLFCLEDVPIPVAAVRNAEAELAKNVRWESGLAPAMLDGNGVDEYLLIRGNSNTPKQPVPRRFLEACNIGGDGTERNDLPATAREAHNGSGRRELAREILQSPLASRVAVNRIWHHLFGRGIVPSVDNLGVLGLPPSHPELLDHLAIQFMRNGWSAKVLIRSLVLSRTYQMSSHLTDADAADPENQLWHRMPIKRLEGEAIRDSLLSVSGRLDGTAFGPSVPIHLTEFMQGRGRPGGSGPLDGNGRRSIYIAVRRNFLSPMMLAFDTPSPFSTVGRRTVSNVPAQALILMNDPLVIEMAKSWAEKILSGPSETTEQRLDHLYLTAFARHPTPPEISEAVAFLNAQGVDRSENQNEAWKNLCHVLFNVKEFVFIE